MDTLFTATRPVLDKRGVHLDLKGVPPTPERLLSLLDLFAAARYNVVLVEWEDSFPWTVDERFRSPTAYTPELVTQFCDKAATLGLELIPLVQCLGHMENPLSVVGYEHLREVPDDESCLNPLAPGARELIQGMVDDVLRLMPHVMHFHLGGDEAWAFGTHPDTKAYVDEHGKGALYLHHVEPILDSLNARNVRSILWHDMMIEWDSAALRSLARKCDLMPWSYQGHPGENGTHCNHEIVKRFTEHGLTLWGASAYKGAEGYDADLPDLDLHITNNLGWAEFGQEYGFKGVIATAWSRYAVDTLQCNPIDSSLDSLLVTAVILHDGTMPEGGVEACVEALSAVGEKDRFDACRDVMSRLAKLRREGWEKIQHARQVMVLAKNEPRRSSAGNPKRGLHAIVRLGTILKKLDEVAEDAPKAFAGLMDPIWLEEYLATRIDPLRDEHEAITADFNTL